MKKGQPKATILIIDCPEGIWIDGILVAQSVSNAILATKGYRLQDLRATRLPLTLRIALTSSLISDQNY